MFTEINSYYSYMDSIGYPLDHESFLFRGCTVPAEKAYNGIFKPEAHASAVEFQKLLDIVITQSGISLFF